MIDKKRAYYNDRKVIKRKRDGGFLSGYKTTYKDNYVKVEVLGENIQSTSSHTFYCYLIRLPNKKLKEVYKSDLYFQI